jgi:hypothetical protein
MPGLRGEVVDHVDEAAARMGEAVGEYGVTTRFIAHAKLVVDTRNAFARRGLAGPTVEKA